MSTNILILDSTSNHGDFIDENNIYVIIVTLLSTFVTTLILVLIFGSIIVWRRKQMKKRKRLNVKYVKESQFESYSNKYIEDNGSTGHYEAIDYQAIDLLDDRPSENHFYTQILD